MVVTKKEKDHIEGIRFFRKSKEHLQHSEELEDYVNKVFTELMED